MLFHLERERVLSIPVIGATNRVTFLDWGSIAECLTPVQWCKLGVFYWSQLDHDTNQTNYIINLGTVNYQKGYAMEKLNI